MPSPINPEKKIWQVLPYELPKLNTEVTGLYHHLLGMITWRGINIIEVISTTHELTIIIKEEHVSAALEALMKIKEKYCN